MKSTSTTGSATILSSSPPFKVLPKNTSVQKSKGRSRMGNPTVFPSLVLGLICASTALAVYDGGSKNGGGDIPLKKSSILRQESAFSTALDSDRVAWEYFVKKYSTSGKEFTEREILQLMSSMQKCQHKETTQIETDSEVNDGAAVSSNDKKTALDANQVTNCNRIIDSIILPGGARALYNQSSFKEICPRLLFYVESEDCCASSSRSKALGDTLPNSSQEEAGAEDLDDAALESRKKPTSGEVWGYGFLLVTIISCSSLVGVSLMPFMGKDFYKHLLTVMIGLAVGSLTGSAVFHLLPQALRLNEHDPNHGYLHISLVIVGGIWLFFMVERILKFIMEYKERRNRNWKREKMSSVLASTPESSSIANVMSDNGYLMKGPLVADANGEQRNSLIFPATPKDTGVIYECQEQAIKASFGHQERPRPTNCHDHHVSFEQGKDSVIATVAWMIIFGDGLHNFIDGLSIGAAFNESIWTGVSISVAVLCEELPHELGDFAVLLNAGMSMRQAVTYNFLSACTCYIGMAVGILLGEIEASVYIFALAGGMFLYISLVDMVPEMNEIAQETSKISLKKGVLTLLLQNIGLFAGVSTLYLLALYQDSFQF